MPAVAEREDVEVDGRALRDFPYRFAVVPIGECYIDRYQRPLSEQWLKARTTKFNPALFGTLTLSERHIGKDGKGGKYSVIDGQHRSVLAQRVDLLEVPAIIFFDLTVEEESMLFSALQRERRAITPLERFNSDLVALKPEALALQRMVVGAGFRFENSKAPGAIKSVVALERAYATEPALAEQVLRLIKGTWGIMPEAANEHMIGAMRLFLDKMGSGLDETKFVAQLEQMTPSGIAQKAAQLRDSLGHTGSIMRFMAEIMENQYSSQKRRRS